jgi:hypothetical protein
MGWAILWADFSRTHLVALFPTPTTQNKDHFNLDFFTFLSLNCNANALDPVEILISFVDTNDLNVERLDSLYQADILQNGLRTCYVETSKMYIGRLRGGRQALPVLLFDENDKNCIATYKFLTTHTFAGIRAHDLLF